MHASHSSKRPATQEKLEGNELEDGHVEEFLASFAKKVLVFPDGPSVLCILAPVGLIGSGKSTVMQALAERFSLVVIRTDAIRAHLNRFGYNNRRTPELAGRLVVSCVERGYGVAVDADVVVEEKRSALQRIARELEVPLVSVHINTPEEVILDRLRPDNPDREFKGPEAVERYFIRKTLHENLDIPFECVVDGAGELETEMDKAEVCIRKALSQKTPR